MRDFVITTESNSDLPAEYMRENGIGVIPHYYTVEEKVYGDGEELSIREFYDVMRAQKKVGTMASNPAVIEEMFKAYAAENKDVLHVSFSSALSGGCGNVQMVAKEVMEAFPDIRIIVVDTLTASLGEGLLIREALRMKQEGKELEETAEYVAALAPHVSIQFTVDDLNHLYRGGRLSKTSALLGTMINIKPILYVNEEGKLVALSKTRGRKKSIQLLVDNMSERLGNYRDKQSFIGIVHGDCPEEAEQLRAMVEERFGYKDFMICPIGPSIGAHSGPGTLGLVFQGENR